MIIIFIKDNTVHVGDFAEDNYSRELFPVFAKHLAPISDYQREKLNKAISELKIALIRENENGRFAI